MLTSLALRMLPLHVTGLKALILDVDGTIYRQGPVRRAMLWRLLRAHVRQPWRGLSTLRVLQAYRTAQEDLRASPLFYGDLSKAQLRLACERTGVEHEVVSSCVSRWMEREPLEVLAPSLCHGVVEFLRAAVEHGLRLGVFSDYPAVPKLLAMGVADYFDVVVSAQDQEVQRFKPSPLGLEVALRRLRVKREEALYIGDRPEIDVPAASGAGIACVIVGRRNVVDRRGWVEISGFRELKDVICYRR